MYALLGFAAVFGLIFAGMPLGYAMTAVGFVGFALAVGFDPARFMVAQIVFDTALSYPYSVLPLFILMGNFVARSRLADDLFQATHAFVGHRPGGLGRATIFACGGFAAVCGSSAATAATMVRVALPAMRARGYDDRLATGVIAVGGTLGILIPPSSILLIYGLITQTDVAKLFAAGIVPGIVAITLHNAVVSVITKINPRLGPPGEKSSWTARLAAGRRVWGVVALFLLIVGGILGGAFTATEGGGIGAGAALLFALSRKSLNWSVFANILVETGRTTAMMFFVLFGALIFSNFIEITGLPRQIGAWVGALDLPPIGVMLVIIIIYIVLGCVLESMSMMFLTIPLFFPVVTGLGYDPVWFGVMLVIVIELGLITPPIGLNVFVMKAMVPDVALRTMFAGIAPFIASMVALLLLILFVPAIALYLPARLLP